MGRKQKSLPKYVLAIDPAKNAGFALFVNRELKAYGAVDGSTWRTMAPVFEIAVEGMQLTDERACVIEDGWWAPGRMNGKGLLTLGRRRGLAQAAAEACGFTEFDYIGPSTWQNALFGALRGRDTKQLSMKYAADQMGVTGVTDDVTDAICLGVYYLQALDLELKAG